MLHVKNNDAITCNVYGDNDSNNNVAASASNNGHGNNENNNNNSNSNVTFYTIQYLLLIVPGLSFYFSLLLSQQSTSDRCSCRTLEVGYHLFFYWYSAMLISTCTAFEDQNFDRFLIEFHIRLFPPRNSIFFLETHIPPINHTSFLLV